MPPNARAPRDTSSSGSFPTRNRRTTTAKHMHPRPALVHDKQPDSKLYEVTPTSDTTTAFALHNAYDDGCSLSEIIRFVPQRAAISDTTPYIAFSPELLQPATFQQISFDFSQDTHELHDGWPHASDDTAFVSQSMNVTTPLGREEPETTPLESSSSSSLVVITPQQGSTSASPSRSISFDTHGTTSVDSVTPEQLQLYQEAAKYNGGPCSNSWKMPQWRTRKSRKDTTKKSARKRGNDDSSDRPRRGPFETAEEREETAHTRKIKACVRCRMNKARCKPDPDDLLGECLPCKASTGPAKTRLICLRNMIPDASLYREQQHPFYMWTKRWKTMDLVNIEQWASDDVKTITISQIFLDCPYQVRVRKFVPQDGDMLEDSYYKDGVVKKYQIPRYALADLEETAKMFTSWIDKNVAKYINGTENSQQSDPFLWETYMKAFQHYNYAKTAKEQQLLADTFRVWVACRKTSNPEHLCGEDKLGIPTVDDPGSTFNGKVPMPVIMIAQQELIMFTTVLRPASQRLLESLNFLVMEKKKCYWYTIYLCCFVLFHSCAMLTKRDEETAIQYALKETYANPESIKAHHSGAQTMLAYWHHANKGPKPFKKALTDKGLKELQAEADLTDDQAEFIRKTAREIQKREAQIKEVRSWDAFGHDWYWVSQLFDEAWKPGPTA